VATTSSNLRGAVLCLMFGTAHARNLTEGVRFGDRDHTQREAAKSRLARAGAYACLGRTLERLETFDKPIAAAVHAANGAATTFLPHGERAFAARGTKFPLPFTDMGMRLEPGSKWPICQRVGIVNEVVVPVVLAATVEEHSASRGCPAAGRGAGLHAPAPFSSTCSLRRSLAGRMRGTALRARPAGAPAGLQHVTREAQGGLLPLRARLP